MLAVPLSVVLRCWCDGPANCEPCTASQPALLQSERFMRVQSVPSMRHRAFVSLLVLSTCVLLAGCLRKSPETLLAEAREHAARADYRTAGIQLRTLLKDDPQNLEGVLLLAEVALKGNNPALAERNYRRAAELGADPSRTWAGTMESLLALGRYQDVLAQAQTDTGVRPFADVADAARQALLIGRAQIGLRKIAAAEEALRESIRLRPSADAHGELSRLLAVTDRQAESEE